MLNLNLTNIFLSFLAKKIYFKHFTTLITLLAIQELVVYFKFYLKKGFIDYDLCFRYIRFFKNISQLLNMRKFILK
jgi:hypothetical protein